MNDLQEKESPTVYERWSQTMVGLLNWPLDILETQQRVGRMIVEAALHLPALPEVRAGPGSEAGHSSAEEFQKLESLALERAQKGLALPREIYMVPYRDRVNWSRFPEWAWPIDPEVFENSGHEG